MIYLPMTDQQAQAQYHRVFDADLYRAATFGIAWVLSYPDEGLLQKLLNPVGSGAAMLEYIQLTNLLIDAALEICGHSLSAGTGWRLAAHLRESASRSNADTETIDRLFFLVDQYLHHFQRHMDKYQLTLEKDHPARTQHWTAFVQYHLLIAARCTSELRGKRGRAVYHFLSASEGITLTALALLKAVEDDHHPLTYAAEKLMNGIKHIFYALSELRSIPQLPSLFQTIYHVLEAWLEPPVHRQVELMAVYDLEPAAFQRLLAAGRWDTLLNNREIFASVDALRDVLGDMKEKAPLEEALVELESFIQQMSADYKTYYFWIRQED